MYDILQLNDMLVPELLDIAEDLKIDNPKKLGKQELIYKILDQQAVASSEQKSGIAPTNKRRRIVKAATANSTEEAIVEEPSEPVAEAKRAPKKAAPPKKEEKPRKAPRKKNEETESSEDKQPTDTQVTQAELSLSQQEAATTDAPQQPQQPEREPDRGAQINKFYPPRREQNFNIEFDGIILAEGVLE